MLTPGYIMSSSVLCSSCRSLKNLPPEEWYLMTSGLHKDTINIKKQQVFLGSGMTGNNMEQSCLLSSKSVYFICCATNIGKKKFALPRDYHISLNGSVPSSAFCSHSTNFFIWSRKTLLPLATCASLYHLRIASSLRTSAEIQIRG